MSYERAQIAGLTAYQPGEQPQVGGVVKLNTNENPYPPAASVMAALVDIDPELLRRYPPPGADRLREAAAALHGLDSAQVIATNGGDELLRLAVTAFVEPGQTLGVATPSYSLYPVLAAIHGARLAAVELTQDWGLPTGFAARMNEARARLVLVVNPHAPSGRLIPVEELATLAAELEGVLLIDEAYLDFVEPDAGYDATTLVREHRNLLLLRSLSKGYSLAGLRCGYGLGDAGLIRTLHKIRDSYNLDAVAQRLATVALQDQDAAESNWRAVREERTRLRAALSGLGLDSPPSSANFLLVTVPARPGLAARDLYAALKARNILVRWFDQPRLRDKLRISVGTPAQNDQLLAALKVTVGT